MNGVVLSGVREAATAPVRTSNIWIVDVGVPRPIRVPSGCTDMALNESSASDERKIGSKLVKSCSDQVLSAEEMARNVDVG